MINIVQIGYGYWGTNVARNIALSQKTRLRALVDMSEDRRQAARTAYQSQVEIQSDYHAYLNDPDVDAFALAIQTEPAFEVAREILSAGKHLFLEKPIAETAEKAEVLTQLAEEKGLILHVDHIMLFHPIIRKIKKMYDDGDLGSLLYFDFSRMNLGPIRKDVNAMIDLAVHDLAVIDFISGGVEPFHVEAIGAKHYGKQETLTYLTLNYPGFLAHVKSSWIAPIKERRTIVGFSKKMVIFDDMKTVDKLTIYDHGIIETGEEYGAYEFRARSGDILIPFIPAEDALRNSIEHFADCVVSGKPSIANGRHGIKIARILDEARAKLAASSEKETAR